jgi:NAD(P)-dependent dehydrogenase (short-subunit alcohol dehydrogenase family)
MKKKPLAIVTGAAHRLGRIFAITLAQRGYAILLHYFNATGVEQTEQEIKAFGVPVFLLQADLRDHSGISSLISSLDAIPHQVDVLVNSASIMMKADLQSTSTADWDATLALNLRAPFLLVQEVVRRMDEGGLVVNISDCGARKLWKEYSAYVVSKSALETLTRLQAKEYAPRIRVNAIAPGLVIPSDGITKDEWERLVKRTPLNRPVRQEDIAGALGFLLDNPSITGQVLSVDGGYSLI